MSKTALALFAVAAFATLASAQNSKYAAELTKLEKTAAALPAEFDQDWVSTSSKVRAKRISAQNALLKGLPSAEAKAAFNKAIAALEQTAARGQTFLTAFRKQQGTQFTALASKYLNLAKSVAQAKGSDVLAARKQKQALLTGWENAILASISDFQVSFDNSLRASIKASKPADAKALESARVSFLQTLFDNKVTVGDTLVNKQFARVEAFALQAGELVFHLLVAANRPL